MYTLVYVYMYTYSSQLAHESGSSFSSILEMRIWQGLSEPQAYTLDLCAAVDISHNACLVHTLQLCIPLALPFPDIPMPSDCECWRLWPRAALTKDEKKLEGNTHFLPSWGNNSERCSTFPMGFRGTVPLSPTVYHAHASTLHVFFLRSEQSQVLLSSNIPWLPPPLSLLCQHPK